MDNAHPRLNILQVSTTDAGGGAEKTAWKLLRAYDKHGYDSWLAVGYKSGQDPRVLEIPNYTLRNWWKYLRKPGTKLWRSQSLGDGVLSAVLNVVTGYRRALDIRRGVEDFNFPGTHRLLKLPPQQPDILHCHNLHGWYFDLRALPRLSGLVPTVLTLHDAWLLSGHCAHSFDCDLWRTGCGKCPDLTIYPPIRRDATAYNWQRKREIYTRSRLYITTPSRWLMRRVEQSILAPAIVESRVIPNGSDLSIFRTADRHRVRAALNIPQDVKVLLFVSTNIRNSTWKDSEMLRTAISLVADEFSGQRLLFLALGENSPPERIGNAEVSFIPYQDDEKIVASYYQASDIYVHAARADTFPNTVIESLACATPVVATGIGGITEQIDDGVSGFLVPPARPDMMAARIHQLFSDDELRLKMGASAAESARRRFDLNRQVNDYLRWYSEILKSLKNRAKS